MANDPSGNPNSADRVERLRELLEETLSHAVFRPGLEDVDRTKANQRFDLASRYIAIRRQREKLFGKHADLFADPAWDILLDLFVNRNRRQINVSSACLAANVPMTTGLRWLCTLEERGLVERSDNPTDRRGRTIELTEIGMFVMNAVLDDGLDRFRR